MAEAGLPAPGAPGTDSQPPYLALALLVWGWGLQSHICHMLTGPWEVPGQRLKTMSCFKSRILETDSPVLFTVSGNGPVIYSVLQLRSQESPFSGLASSCRLHIICIHLDSHPTGTVPGPHCFRLHSRLWPKPSQTFLSLLP